MFLLDCLFLHFIIIVIKQKCKILYNTVIFCIKISNVYYISHARFRCFYVRTVYFHWWCLIIFDDTPYSTLCKPVTNSSSCVHICPQVPSKSLLFAVWAACIGGTFQYGYNISVINAPTKVKMGQLVHYQSLTQILAVWVFDYTISVTEYTTFELLCYCS